jgi:ABC-type multidrug transport system fused ATPase/permease subunit
LIQSSIRREFASATVLTIAHRVQTIIDYDKVMVLKQGRVVYGSPKKLMAIKGGELASMVAVRTG